MRPVESAAVRHQVVGPCYVNGIMNGEAVAELQEDREVGDFEKVFRQVFALI
jgi:hypothetical protein